MHVTHLDDHASPLAAFSASPFRPEEWRNLGLAIGAPGRPCGQRHYPTDSQIRTSSRAGRSPGKERSAICVYGQGWFCSFMETVGREPSSTSW
jgi:hypothetical protein